MLIRYSPGMGKAAASLELRMEKLEVRKGLAEAKVYFLNS